MIAIIATISVIGMLLFVSMVVFIAKLWWTVTKVILKVASVIIAIMVVLVGITYWGLTSSHEQEKTAKATSSGITVVDKIIKYDYYWKLDNGQYVNGQNEAKLDERTVELARLDENHLYLDQQYTQCGSPQTARFRLQKIGDRLWEGSFGQDYPEDHGRVTLQETAPGIYSGKQVWDDGKTAICSFKRR